MAEYPFFSGAYRTHTKIDHQLGHIINLNKFKRTEVVQNMSSHHSGIKLEINRKITGQSPKDWKLRNTLLNNP